MSEKGDEFWKYYGPTADVVIRHAVLTSIENMLNQCDESTRELFFSRFAQPMARLAKVPLWRDLPMDKLSGLHDLVARTKPAPSPQEPEPTS